MPRDPNRIPRITGKVTALWIQNPDMRLGQLITNVWLLERTITATVSGWDSMFNVEDDEFELALDDELMRHANGTPWRRI